MATLYSDGSYPRTRRHEDTKTTSHEGTKTRRHEDAKARRHDEPFLSVPKVGVPRSVLRLERDEWSRVKNLRQAPKQSMSPNTPTATTGLPLLALQFGFDQRFKGGGKGQREKKLKGRRLGAGGEGLERGGGARLARGTLACTSVWESVQSYLRWGH